MPKFRTTPHSCSKEDVRRYRNEEVVIDHQTGNYTTAALASKYGMSEKAVRYALAKHRKRHE